MARFKVKKRSPLKMLISKESKEGLAYKIYWFIIALSRSNKVFRLLIDYSALLFYKLVRGKKSFVFEGKRYRYFYHAYNRTIASERVIEIPIAKSFLDKFEGKDILEVGNVMSHYFPINHDVLDKYEKAEGVINEDVINFKSNKKYDLIISVSTMEHVGYSYGEEYNPKKFSKGIENLVSLLKPEGLLVVTFSLFYNEYLTNLIVENRTSFNKEIFFRRTSFWNEWNEVNRKEAILEAKEYDAYYANSNILYIGIFNRTS